MAKLENNLVNMVASLTAITVIVGGLLGAVNFVTMEPIQKAKDDKQAKAISAVVPVEGAVPGECRTEKAPNETEALVFPVTKDGKLVGNAVQAQSKNGFGGTITVMFGFDVEGKILGYSVLDCSQETPGLGAKMPTWFQEGQKGNVIGKNPAKNNLAVSKDGGEVDAITAATISSRAFLDALAQASAVLTGKTDVATSASQQVSETKPCCEQAEGECAGACEKTEGDSCCHKCPNETVTE